MCETEISDEIREKIDKIALDIVDEHRKGKFPLFVVGSGISMDLQNRVEDGVQETTGIPTMVKMIEKLYSLYEESEKDEMPEGDKEDLKRRFEIWNQDSRQGGRLDRSIVAGILGYFQEKEYLQKIWLGFNRWLLNKCVNEKLAIGIINASPSIAHEKITELYREVNAFCLTTNFDGLFYEALRNRYGVRETDSYYMADKAKRFFTEENHQKKKYVEIQVRGDIFFVECDSKWCDDYNSCGCRSEEPKRIWESKPEPLVCERDQRMKPFISFPGTYEKDKEVREILSILWQYLTHRVSCIITIGIGGWWDPILTAFLSDLQRERNIPFIDVNASPECSYIAKEIVSKEIVSSGSSLKISANNFMSLLNQSIMNIQKLPEIQIVYSYSRDDVGEDRFWAKILKRREISDFEKALIKHPLVAITDKFAQLGLESSWWGIEEEQRWAHNRLNHSKGVMKIATFLYEKACKNSGRPERAEEKQFLRIAALLHDIGHLPFSHSIERVFQELNWKPAGYIESFSHDYYTEEKVKKIFGEHTLKEQLGEIGYTVDDLIGLIRGEFGIGFLDAIINGPIDADKMDYVFRDAASVGFSHQIEPKQFFDDMGNDVSISPMGLLVLKGSSAHAAFTILEQRERLYRDFYLSPALGLLEKAMRFIVITYFVHKHNTDEVFTDKNQRLLRDETQFSDLGAIKIAKASEELEKLVEDFEYQRDIEMEIVKHMKTFLDAQNIDKRVKAAIGKCLSLVKQEGIGQVNHRTWCREEERGRRQELSNSEFSRESMQKIRRDAKTVALRFPGAILIDIVPPFKFFKIAETRRPKARGDGTNVCSKCMLSADLDRMVERHESRNPERGQVRVYKLGEESEVKAALALFKSLLGEGGRLVEEE